MSAKSLLITSTLLCNGAIIGCGSDGASPCEPDPTYDPKIDPSDFSTLIDNPLMPLPVGAKWELESDEEKITITVLDETYTTANGVVCLVVHDQAREKDSGDVIEDTRDWFAQDAAGNVWYMGEDTAEYENGKVVSTEGSWEAGADGAKPGIVMYAAIPKVGTTYRQEYYACEAEDMGEILSKGDSVTVLAGSYSDCIRTRDFTPLEPDAKEIKTYCPGVGNVLVEDESTGEREEELISFSVPD
jgi:hypothetical protein